MASVAGAAVRMRAERRFYTGMAAAILAMVFIGFAPSYFLRGVIDPGHPLIPMTPLVHLHGLVFSGWILLFMAQTSLIAGGRADIHRKLGMAGVAMVAVMIILGIVVALYGVHRPSQPPGMAPLSWLAIPLLDVPVYGALISAGLLNRRTPQTHKRFMLIAMIAMLPPAIGRMPWPEAIVGPITLFVLPDLFLIPLVLWDLKTRGRVHPVTIGAGLFVIGSQILRLAIWESEGWLAFAAWSSSFAAP